MPAAGWIMGYVKDVNGVGIPGCTVTFDVLNLQTDSSGYYIGMRSPGIYDLTIQKSGYVQYGPQSIYLKEADAITNNVTLSAKISGTVYCSLENHSYLPYAQVQFYHTESETSVFGMCNQYGAYSINVLPGAGILHVYYNSSLCSSCSSCGHAYPDKLSTNVTANGNTVQNVNLAW